MSKYSLNPDPKRLSTNEFYGPFIRLPGRGVSIESTHKVNVETASLSRHGKKYMRDVINTGVANSSQGQLHELAFLLNKAVGRSMFGWTDGGEWDLILFAAIRKSDWVDAEQAVQNHTQLFCGRPAGVNQGYLDLAEGMKMTMGDIACMRITFSGYVPSWKRRINEESIVKPPPRYSWFDVLSPYLYDKGSEMKKAELLEAIKKDTPLSFSFNTDLMR